jgi:hypothetical protein
MKMWPYQFAFFLYKMLVRPFKRTPMRWSAILYNRAGQFAIEHDNGGRRLPAGDLKPGYPIPELCRCGLGLDKSQFTSAGQLRLIGVVGRGGEEFTFYYSGEVSFETALIKRFGNNISFVDRSELNAFLPAEIATHLT